MRPRPSNWSDCSVVPRHISVSSLFSGIKSPNRKDFFKQFSKVEIKSDSIVVAQGSRPDLFVLSKGSAQCSFFNFIVEKETMYHLQEGDFVGLPEILSGKSSVFWVKTLSDSSFLHLPRKMVRPAFERYPALAFSLLHLFSQELNGSLKDALQIL
ncbi:MAG: cyclic nucleotide-binding domain-containing protein [Pyrinomonadaceae bacterium]